MALPAYLIERVRRAPPADSCIVPGSTPVVAFGNARVARVATLGLNPSRVEFLDRAGQPFAEPRRRLETLASLEVERLTDASVTTITRVVAGCDAYFQRNPYWQWFRPLEAIIAGLGASYAAGTACHLDLVQWATDPVWGRLPDTVRQHLITDDAAFLQQQLREERITTLLLNGRGVITNFAAAMQMSLQPVRTIADRTVRCTIVAGSGPGRLAVVGWSVNLQSSFGVTKVLRHMLAESVAEIVAQMR